MASTAEQRAAGIDLFLRTIHVFSLQPAERRNITATLANSGVTVGMVRMVWDEVRATSHDDDRARGLLAITLRQPAAVTEIVADIEDRRARVRGGAGSEPSAMACVERGNPYGWAQPANVRLADHGRPGEWNAYRQCYNMTEAERLEAHAPDCRRQGCGRVEMVGEFDRARVISGKDIAPDPFYDAEGVASAQDARGSTISSGEADGPLSELEGIYGA